MKTQSYSERLTKEYFYPRKELKAKIAKKAKELDQSKSLTIVQILEKALK